MPRFLELERRERSVILALWRPRAAPRRRSRARAARAGRSSSPSPSGMEELVTPLAARLPAGRGAAQGSAWPRSSARGAGWRVDDRGRRRLRRPTRVILAAEAHQAARLAALRRSRARAPARGDPVRLVGDRDARPIAAPTSAIPSTASASWCRSAERRRCLAGTFSSVKYPGRAPEGHVLLRVFSGGALNEAALEARTTRRWSRSRARSSATCSASTGAPLFTRVAALPARDAAVPRRPPGPRGDHRAGGWRGIPGLRLAGGAYRGVGIADCVRSGEDAAEGVLGA